MYEHVLESESTKLSEVTEITSKREKILKLMEENKPNSKILIGNSKKNSNNNNNIINYNNNLKPLNTNYYNKIPFVSDNNNHTENSDYNNKFENNNFSNNLVSNKNFLILLNLIEGSNKEEQL